MEYKSNKYIKMVDLKDNIADLDLEGVEAILEEERRKKQKKLDREKDTGNSNIKYEDKPYKSRYDKFEKVRENKDKKYPRSKSRSRSKKRERERTRDYKKRSTSRKNSRERRRHSRSNSRKKSSRDYKHSEANEDRPKDQKLIDKQIDEASNLLFKSNQEDKQLKLKGMIAQCLY